MKFILENTSEKYEQMGGKATALAKIGKVIDNIPEWFVISYKGFDIEGKEIINDAKIEIQERLKPFPENTYYAVRSSALNEDSKENSFAGQFDTFLYIKKNDVIDKVKEVYLSAFSERIETYRKENNIEEISIPCVIVQKMVNSEKAGVAFGANPVNSNIKEIVITAVYGLGSSLVDGIASADTYTILNNEIKKEIPKKDFYHKLENDIVIQKELEEEIKNYQVLEEKQILEVKELVQKANDYFGRYQDIEWAYENEKLYLLQSRPITTLGNRKDQNGRINVFDNSNIVESYGGITTPLTFSFIRTVYENVYIELCKIFNVKQEKLEVNSQMFKNMLALIDGRVYYNLYGWYGILSMFPGLGSNKKFMEQMMGVKESLPDDLFPVPQATFKDKIGLVNTGYGLVKGFFKIRKMTDIFYDRLNDALEEKNIENMDLYELHDYYYELESKLLHKWDAPLVNDFLAMIFYGQLKQKCLEIFKEEGNLVHNDLLCSEGGIISAEPAKRIKELAGIAKESEELISLLENNDILYVKKELPYYPEFNKKLNEYLDKFSDRCLQELKLETETLKDNPRSLYHSISTFAKRMKETKIETVDSEKARINAEKKVKQVLRLKPIERTKFNFILKHARFTVKNRENLRFERTRLFGRVREIFLRIGYILTSMNVIDEKRDIFYLEVDEILYYIDGKSTTNNLRELIQIRKTQYMKYKETLPDERFYSYGAVNIGNNFRIEKVEKEEVKKVSLELKGIGASPGKVTGRVRIIRNPVNAKIEQGEILVAEYTDPGWIMLFPAASGILVERGSLLSHSAIVSRELGIPAVVGITGLLNTLKDGDEVELDGTTGIVKKLNVPNVDNQKITDLKDMLSKSVKKYSDKILYKLEDKEITYQEMQEKVNYLGTSLIDLGLKNKRIAIISENRYEWEISYFAIICGTGIVVPLDRSLAKEEIITILKRAKVEAVFCSEKYENILLDIKNDLEDLKYIISFNEKKELSFNKLIEKGKKLIDSGNREFIDAKIDNEDVGFIMFTSGTTGKSKAVMLSHKNVCTNLVNVSQVFPIDYKDIALSVLPLNHVLEGLFCLLLTILKGATRTYCYDLKDIIEDINRYKVSFMGAVPAIYEYIYKRIDEIQKENINIFMCGGASLEPELEQKFKENGINLVQGYGITETAPVISMSNLETHKIGAVGKVIPNTQVKIINKDAENIGEIAVKGDNVFLGYYQDNEETELILKQGWFYTGDLGKIDDEGYLFICGRLKNMIVLSNGKKIFPEEIESIINKINGVKEAFVFDRKVSENKTIICTKVVCKNLNQKEEILNRIWEVNKNISHYKQIQAVYITDENLLKTTTGKIKRTEELQLVNFKNYTMKNINENVEVEKDSIQIKLQEMVGKQLGIDYKNIKEDMSLTDMGADSLDKVEIIIALEKEFKIKVPKEEYANIKSIKDIISLYEIN